MLTAGAFDLATTQAALKGAFGVGVQAPTMPPE
jgi:hypothetical protein